MFDFSSFLSNKAFITEDHHVYTYADLLGLSERFSEHLVPRSLIFIGCENSLESIVAYVSYRQTMEYDFAYISEVITPACFKKSEPNDFTALQRYISRKIVFPQDLAHSGISGRVIITFIVDTDGSVKIDKVLESPHPKMSYRVKKIILSTSGKWTPATYFGAPIQQRFSIPVDFRLR